MDTFDLIDAIVTRPAAAGMILPHPFFLARAQEGGGRTQTQIFAFVGFFCIFGKFVFFVFFCFASFLGNFRFLLGFFSNQQEQ